MPFHESFVTQHAARMLVNLCAHKYSEKCYCFRASDDKSLDEKGFCSFQAHTHSSIYIYRKKHTLGLRPMLHWKNYYHHQMQGIDLVDLLEMRIANRTILCYSSSHKSYCCGGGVYNGSSKGFVIECKFSCMLIPKSWFGDFECKTINKCYG